MKANKLEATAYDNFKAFGKKKKVDVSLYETSDKNSFKLRKISNSCISIQCYSK